MPTILFNLNDRIFQRQARRIYSATDAIARGFDRSASSLGGVKKLLATGLGFGALTGFITSAIGEVLAFDKNMREVNTLINESFGSISELSDAVKIMSIEFGAVPAATAQALYQIISAGAKDSAEAILTLDAANKLAIGGVTNVALAADGLTSVLTAFGKSAGDLTEITDTMFIAMREGKTTIAELSASVGDFAPIAAQTGISIQEMFAATAALTKGGLSTAQAFTGLRQAVLNITKPTNEAIQLQKFLNQEYKDFEFSAARLQEVGLAQFMEEVKEATGGSSQALATFFGSIQGFVAVAGLTGNQWQDFLGILNDMETDIGETEVAFRKMLGPMFEVQSLMQNITVAKLDFGEKAAKAMHDVLINLNDNFKNVVQSTYDLVAAIIQLRLAVLALQKATLFIGALAVAFKKFDKTITPIVGTAWALTKAFGALSGVKALAYFGGKWLKNLFSFQGVLKLVIGSLGLVIKAFNVLTYLAIAKWIADILYNAGFLREELDWLAQVVDGVVAKLKYAFEVSAAVVSSKVAEMGAFLRQLWAIIETGVQGAITTIASGVTGSLGFVATFISGAYSLIGLDRLSEKVEMFAQTMLDKATFAINKFTSDTTARFKELDEQNFFVKSGQNANALKDKLAALSLQRDREIESAKTSTWVNNRVSSAYETLIDKAKGAVGITKDLTDATKNKLDITKQELKQYQSLRKELIPTVDAQQKLEEAVSLTVKVLRGSQPELTAFTKEHKLSTEQVLEFVNAEESAIQETELYQIILQKLTERYKGTTKAVEGNTNALKDNLRMIEDIEASTHPLLQANLEYARRVDEVEMAMEAANITGKRRIEILKILKNQHDENVDAALGLVEINERLAAVQEMAKERTKEYTKEIENMRDAREQDKKSAIDWAKVMQDSVERAIDRVNDAFVDLWASAFKGFKDFGKSLKDAFVQLLATLAHEAITKPIVMNIAASFTGGLTSGLGSAAGNIVGGLFSGGSSNLIESLGLGALVKGGSNLLGSVLSGGKGLLNGLLGLGGAGAIGSGGSILGSAGGALTPGGIQAASGFEVLAGQSGLTAPLPGGGGILKGLQSSAVASAVSGFLGSQAAKLLGLGGGTGGAIGGTAGSLVGSAIGGPIGAGIGGFIGSALGGLFGGKPSNKAQIRGLNFRTGDISKADGGSKKFSQEVYDAAETILSEVQLAQQAIEEATGATIGAGSLSFDIGRRDPTKIRVGDRHAETAVGDPVAAFNKIVEFMVDSLEGGSEMLVGVLQDTFESTGDINKAIQAVVAKQEELASLELEVSVLKDALSVFATVLEDDPVTKALAGISTEVVTFEQSLMNLSSNFSSVTDSFLAGDLTLQDFLSSIGTAQNVMVDYANRINAIRIEGTGRIDSILNDIYESSLTDAQLVDRRWDELGSVLEMIGNTTDPGELQRLINMVASQTQEALGIVSRLDEEDRAGYTEDFQGLLVSAKTRFEEQLSESQSLLEDANLQMREQIILANDHVVALHEDAAMRHEEAANAQMIAAETNKNTSDVNAEIANANSETAATNSETAGVLYNGANVFSGAVSNFANTNITVNVEYPQVGGYWG